MASTSFYLFILYFIFLFFISPLDSSKLDPNGYLLYCPCMGRLGNQVDHLLGSIAFAKKLNRTLVVPPFISYNYITDNKYVSYSDWFDVNKLAQFHRVIVMKDFMKNLSPLIWKNEDRFVYCHEVAVGRSKDKKSCPAKDGNPFKPFWDHFNVTFSGSKLFRSSFHSSDEKWKTAFPVKDNLVMAFMGAMASYPVLEGHRHIQSYIEWSEPIISRRDDFINSYLTRPYLAIHLRNGMDWKRACGHVDEVNGIDYHFMSSPQCTGYDKNKKFTYEMCYPQEETIKKEVLALVQKHQIATLFVATDSNPMLQQFRSLFAAHNLKTQVVENSDRTVELDLAVMIEADHFIGSCASSITAFVVRKREVLNKPNRFSGMEPTVRHTEL